MNKIAFNILTVPVLAVLAVSCGGQDEIYKEWVKKGGYDYPAKAINLSSVIGYQNVIVNWEKPMDPASGQPLCSGIIIRNPSMWTILITLMARFP